LATDMDVLKVGFQNGLYLILGLNTCSGLYNRSILKVDSERKSHKTVAFRQSSDHMCVGMIKGHVVKPHLRVALFQALHGAVNWQAHGPHASTTDHDIFILINDLLEFCFRVYML